MTHQKLCDNIAETLTQSVTWDWEHPKGEHRLVSMTQIANCLDKLNNHSWDGKQVAKIIKSTTTPQEGDEEFIETLINIYSNELAYSVTKVDYSPLKFIPCF